MSEQTEIQPNCQQFPQPYPDFNYPPMNRKDLMNLSTINNKDMKIKQFKKLDTCRDWSINLYNLDIEGSSPRRNGAFHQKIDYTNKNDDIERSWPKILHYGLNKPEYNLTNKDIEFSSPGCVKIQTNRHLNPLWPQYTFSKYETLPFTAPKFIRDGIQISDIEGAHPKKIISHAIKRDTLNKEDILGASTTQPYIRKSKYSSMDYRDVTHDEFKTGRQTNPIDPVYHLSYVDGTKTTIGEIEKSKPIVFSNIKYEDPLNLKTSDIDGTSVGSKNRISKFCGGNYIYNTKDIPGAQTGTLKKGIITKRNLNPCWPKYKYIGDDEMKTLTDNNPYFNKKKLMGSININTDNEDKNTNNYMSQCLKTQPKFEEKTTTEVYQKLLKENKKVIDENNKKLGDNNIKNNYSLNIDDFNNRAVTEENTEFDKNNFKKPMPFYGIVHDKFIIPPIEKHKKSSVSPMENMKNIQNKIATSTSFNNKNFSSLQYVPKNRLFNGKATYAQKLDQFMTDNNIKFIEPEAQKIMEPKPESTFENENQTQNNE